MQRYVIITTIYNVPDGTEFLPQDYPLHITVVPSFRLHTIDKEVLVAIANICQRYSYIKVTAGGTEFFGPQHVVKVTSIIHHDSLQSLHQELAAVLASNGAMFDEPQYMGSNYRPHASAQKTEALLEGSSHTITQFSIIDKCPDNNPQRRRLLKTFSLGEK